MNSDKNPSRKFDQVFVSHSASDNEVARKIAEALKGAGLRVWFDQWSLKPGDSIGDKIEEALQASDLLLVLLSKSSVNSKWVKLELEHGLSKELNSRAVTVIPAVIEDCEVPFQLAHKQVVDLRSDFEAGLARLVSELKVAPAIDFGRLDASSFEVLVTDLLTGLGFAIERSRPSADSGFDLIATHTRVDPFGTEVRDCWLVETKLYQDQRVSVQALRQMIGYMVTKPRAHKGLVVTSSQMTSVALDFLESARESSGRELRIIDGPELRALLLKHPDLVTRHFANEANQ